MPKDWADKVKVSKLQEICYVRTNFGGASERGLVGCAGGVVNRQDVATNTLLLFVNFLNVQRELYGDVSCWERIAEAVIHASNHSSRASSPHYEEEGNSQQGMKTETCSDPGVSLY